VRRPLTRGIPGRARWSLEAPILLAVPFAVLALASLLASPPFALTRWLGSLLLLALCLGSITAGIRRKKCPRSCGSDPQKMPGIPDAYDAEYGHSAAPQGVTIEMSRLTKPLILTGPFEDGQFRAATALAAIGVVGLTVATFLLIGQVNRSGPVTPLGLFLSSLLFLVPAVLAVHLAVRRISVALTPRCVRVICRRDLFRSSREEWGTAELRSVRLIAPARGAPVVLVLEGRSRTVTVPLWGLVLEQAHAMLGLACSRLDAASALPI
jgi:hypothetical protein